MNQVDQQIEICRRNPNLKEFGETIERLTAEGRIYRDGLQLLKESAEGSKYDGWVVSTVDDVFKEAASVSGSPKPTD